MAGRTLSGLLGQVRLNSHEVKYTLYQSAHTLQVYLARLSVKHELSRPFYLSHTSNKTCPGGYWESTPPDYTVSGNLEILNIDTVVEL